MPLCRRHGGEVLGPGRRGGQEVGSKKGKKSAAVARKKKKCKKKGAAVVPAGDGQRPELSSSATSPPPPPPDTRTTFDKIDDAVASSEVAAEQGLTYKVFAAFGDPRLPLQYVGVPDGLAEAPLDQVQAQWDQLSDGAKATLGPFLVPPMHEGSYWQQQIEGTAPERDGLPEAGLTARRQPEFAVVRRQCGHRLPGLALRRGGLGTGGRQGAHLVPGPIRGHRRCARGDSHGRDGGGRSGRS